MYRSIEDFIKDWELESEGTAKIFSALTDEVPVYSARMNWKIKQFPHLFPKSWISTNNMRFY